MPRHEGPDRSSAHRPADAASGEGPVRAGAGKTAASVYREGAGRAPGLPFMDVLLTSEEERHAPVTREEMAEIIEKQKLIAAIAGNFDQTYQQSVDGVNTACGFLEHRKLKDPGFMRTAVSMAAGAAIAGAAGVVASLVGQHLARGVADRFTRYRQLHERFSIDALKEHIKKSFHVGLSAEWTMQGDVIRANFQEAQLAKLRHAQSDFRNYILVDAGMEDLPLDVLRSMWADSATAANDEEIARAHSRTTAIEWANLVAKLRHGGGEWDPWAGEHGSEHARPTDQSAKPPRLGVSEHPSNGNVASQSEGMRDIVDNDQRKMNPATEGILEIDIFVAGRGPDTWSVFERSGFGMRIDGVNDYVKSKLVEHPSVGDLKINKIVSIYSDLRMNPPKPDGRFLITADGYIRRWTLQDERVDQYAAFAQGLSTRLLR